MSGTRGHQAGRGHTVIEDIDQYLAEGMPVLDKDGRRIGEVKLYSTIAGYLMVKQRPLDQRFLYIPFRLIRSVDPREIFLTETKATVTSRHTEPPKITTVSATRQDTGTSRAAAPTARQVQMVESGYDSAPVEYQSVETGDIANQLAIGMIVCDVIGNRLGDITQCDASRGIIVVQKGQLRPHVVQVPFSAIRSIERDTFTVYLSLPSDIVIKEYAVQPDNAMEMSGWSHLGEVDLNTGQPARGGPVPAEGRIASFPDGNNVVGTATDTGVPTGLPFKSKVVREAERRAAQPAGTSVESTTGHCTADDGA
ncbi:MAG TPA: hypothetical protein VF818_06830 [Ktedonobacterales bacterium]